MHPSHTQPLVQIGWIVAVSELTPQINALSEQVAALLIAQLQTQLPNFTWRLEREQHGRFAPTGQLDPLPLLELGVQDKLRFGWDYAFVIVPNELLARDLPRTLGVPSSALEVMVLSLAPFVNRDNSAEKGAALALHLFGHVMGLTHQADTPMQPPGLIDALTVQPYSDAQRQFIADRLNDVADSRLEERPNRLPRLAFYLHALRADPVSIIEDIWQYRPWQLPLRLGRLTATTSVTMLLLLIAAESWEVGTQLNTTVSAVGTLLAVLAATTFIFVGKNLGEVSRGVGMREQLVRTRVVVFFTLLLGVTTLWLVLFGVSFGAGMLLPRQVIAGWSTVPNFGMWAIGRQAAFMAMLGVLAGALGGNLENEDELKADLFFDEET